MPVLGFQELLVILLICVLVFGAKRLPEIGSGLAKGIRSFKKGISSDPDELPEKEEGPMASSSTEETSEKNQA